MKKLKIQICAFLNDLAQTKKLPIFTNQQLSN